MGTKLAKYGQAVYGNTDFVYVGAYVQTTEDNDSVNASSDLLVQATLTSTEDNDSVNASSQLLIKSVVNTTEDDDTIFVRGFFIARATASFVEDDDTVFSVLWKKPFFVRNDPLGSGPYTNSVDSGGSPFNTSSSSYIKPYRE